MILELGDYFAGFIAAFLASITGSFAGGGSSLVMMPLLMMYLPGSYPFLLAVNKLRGLVMNSVSGAIHMKENKLNFRLLLVIVFFGLLGTAVGTYIVELGLNEALLGKVLAVILFVTAGYLWIHPSTGRGNVKMRKMRKRNWVVTSVFSFFLNIISGMFGGTGIFMTGFLVVYLRMPFIKAAAHTMLIYVLLNFAQSVYFFFTVETNFALMAIVTLGAIFGSFAGTKLQYLKGNKWVKSAAILMMIVIGVRLYLG